MAVSVSDPLLVVAAHDAGGAEIISSWLRRIYYPYPGLQDRVWFCLGGPAKEIFQRKLGTIPENKGTAEKARLVLCGTSATSYVEKRIVDTATRGGQRTAVWLDHWKQYTKRFWQDGIHGPLEIWVTDEHAASLARNMPWPSAGQQKIVTMGNPYLVDLLADIRVEAVAVEPRQESHLLIVYDRGADMLVLDPKTWGQVRHRYHPADRLPTQTLAADLAWADAVLGWDSMALVGALLAKKRTYSVLPSWERHIPYDGIVYVPDLTRPANLGTGQGDELCAARVSTPRPS